MNNNSQDRTRQLAQEMAGKRGLNIRYMFETRQGKSYALNAGIRGARGEIVALTDDDVIVDTHWLYEVKKTFDKFDCIGVGGKIIALWPCPKPRWLGETPPYKLATAIISFDQGERPCGLRVSPLGANLSFRKAVFDRYGFFRTDLGPSRGTLMTGEDSEFFHRITKSGERVMYSPSAIVYHPVDPNRIRKEYYRSWCFHDGRGRARWDGTPGNTVYYFGIPRYLFRSLLEDTVRWIASFKPKKRFYYELRLWKLAGQILEARRLSMKRAAPCACGPGKPPGIGSMPI